MCLLIDTWYDIEFYINNLKSVCNILFIYLYLHSYYLSISVFTVCNLMLKYQKTKCTSQIMYKKFFLEL